MRKAILIATLVSLTLVVLIFVTSKQAFKFQGINRAQALWNSEQLVIVLQERSSIMEVGWLRRQIARASWAFAPLPQELPDTVIILRLQGGEIYRYEHERFGNVGGAFPYENQQFACSG